MITKTVEYTDFNGNKRTDTLYFNLTEAELMDMELSEEGGLSGKLSSIVESNDKAGLLKFLKNFILNSYGEKSEDGRRFVKNDTIRDEFAQSAAFSKLLMDMLTDDAVATEFVNGIVPASLREYAEKADAIELAEKK